jgi:hypothetical protein
VFMAGEWANYKRFAVTVFFVSAAVLGGDF